MKTNKKGFTMLELLIIIAIIGILAGIGYPTYLDSVTKAQRADGADALLSLAGRMEEFYLNNDTYASADIVTLMGSTDSPEKLYTLSFLAAPTRFGYTLVATPVVADTDCTSLRLDNLGARTSTGTSAVCW